MVTNIGSKVKFNSINTNDSVIWVGEIVGFVDSSVASIVTDIVNYQEEVKKDTPAINDLDTLSFFILEVNAEGLNTKKIAFAKEWVNESSFELLDNTSTVHISIPNVPDSQVTTVLQILRDANYQPRLTVS